MDLITVLACGVASAASGSARIYRRGTTSAATYYNDADGLDPITTGAAIDLNSYGQAVVYVNEPVTVVVNSSSASGVLTFDHMVSAPVVEVRSQSFTGTDYDDAESGASKPTTLQEVLDAWYDSAGALDFKVDVGGVDTDLSTAVSAATRYYVVTDVAYGAAGDGITDDAASIQAAVDAAEADGGGVVYFPSATYKITSAIAVPDNVSLAGDGGTASFIRLVHATRNAIEVTFAAASSVSIRDLNVLIYDAAYTGSALAVSGTGVLFVSDCYLNGGEGAGISSAGLTADIHVKSCVIGNSGATSSAVSLPTSQSGGAEGTATFVNCLIAQAASAFTGDVATVQEAAFIGCDFWSYATSGAVDYLNAGGGSGDFGCRVVGCKFKDGDGATVRGIEISDASAWLMESDNWFGTSVTPYVLTVAPAETTALTHCSLASRDARRTYEASAGGVTLTKDALGTRNHVIRLTANGNITINLSPLPPQGHSVRLSVYNNVGGNSGTITVQGGGSTLVGHTPAVITNGQIWIFDVECEDVTGTLKGYLLSDSVKLTA